MVRACLAVVLAAAALAQAEPAAAQVTGSLPPPRSPIDLPVPTLRRSVTVASEVVRLGDLIDNAGRAASAPVFRAPDVGTTGFVAAYKVVEAARANNLPGVETGDIVAVEVTREGRVISRKEIEGRIARLFAGTNGLGDASDLVVTFDREATGFAADLPASADLRAMRAIFDPRSSRYDVVFEVPIGASRRTLMRYTGSVVEFADAVVPTRGINRGEIVKAADLAIERRPKAETIDGIAATRDAIGRAARVALRFGQPIRRTDLVKPDLVKRDENITLVYQVPGLLLTARGKALEGGGEGDVVNVLNVQSNSTVQGTVAGPGRVEIAAATVRPSSFQPADEPSTGPE